MLQKENQVEIVRLSADEGERLKRIRLKSLLQDPLAFGTTFREADEWPSEKWATQAASIATFLATVDGRDVGIVRGLRDPDDASIGWLISMWVAPEARGRNVGGRLIDAVVEWAKLEKLRLLQLDVGDHNVSAIALYARKGFLPNGTKGTLPAPREDVTEHQRDLAIGAGGL